MCILFNVKKKKQNKIVELNELLNKKDVSALVLLKILIENHFSFVALEKTHDHSNQK